MLRSAGSSDAWVATAEEPAAGGTDCRAAARRAGTDSTVASDTVAWACVPTASIRA